MPLVAIDGSWAFCLPKKTGSQSLVGMLEGVAAVVGDWHGCEWDGTGRRLMVVRNPYERLASAYWHQRVEGNNLFGTLDPLLWLLRFIETIPQRHKAWCGEWVVSQSEMAAAFRPDRVFRLEDGLQHATSAVGVTVPVQYRHVGGDKHTRKLPFTATFAGAPPEVSAAVEAYCRPDVEAWY